MNWKPKLGDLLPGQGHNLGSVERRFLEVGFDLQQTLAGQSLRRRRDKNSEGYNPLLTTGDSTMEHPAATAQSANPHQVADAVKTIREAGGVAGFPVVLQFDPKMNDTMAALAKIPDAMAKGPPPMPLGQDLARFGGKVVIAGTSALGFGLLYHWLTKPPAMDM